MDKSYVKKVRQVIPKDKIMLVSCCAVIANDEGKILLQKRSDNLLWGLPGGLKELDETLIECAKREVLEETNLDVEIVDFIGVYINPSMSWFDDDVAEVIAFGFEARVTGGELRINDSESLEFGYFDLDNLPQIHALDNELIIKDYYKGIRSGIEGRFQKER